MESNTEGYLTIFGGTAIAKVDARNSLPTNRKKLKEKFDIAIHLFKSN